MAENIFPDGMHYEMKEIEKAPWIKASISFRVGGFIEFLNKHVNDRGFVNIDVKESKAGKLYCALNECNKKDAVTKETGKYEHKGGVEYPEDADDVAASIPF